MSVKDSITLIYYQQYDKARECENVPRHCGKKIHAVNFLQVFQRKKFDAHYLLCTWCFLGKHCDSGH